MNHLAVLPLAIPALAGALLLIFGGNRPLLARALGLAATALGAAAAAMLAADSLSGEYRVYALGNWAAPFGIVLVADRLSALLVLLTSVIAMAALAYAANGWDLRGRHFHALFQFQLMGINGAFLTGDLFNLFVFFEVLLIASYCLLLHGLGQQRLRAAVHYVAVNLTGSGVFLIAVSLLYGVTGTLNMAQLAERIAQAPEADIALVRAAGLMLLGVFAVKAALFPLYFWLPATYASASAPVAALFAIMTKVGVYSILRVTTLMFGGDSGAASNLVSPWLLPLALLTLALGVIGALGAKRLGELVAHLTIASVGTLLTTVAAGGSAALAGALYYLVHSTVIVAALFLLTDLIARQRGAAADALVAAGALRQPVLLGIAFLLGAATVAGAPPSAGFLGKVMILQGTAGAGASPWIWATILASSLAALVACSRAGSVLLWKVGAEPAPEALPARGGEWLSLGALMAVSLLLVAFAGPLHRHAEATAAQLLEPAQYVQSVVGGNTERAPRPLGRELPR
ncbi:MAG: monovalent cation/H+ antiporter subunit D [Burkholderiales bacterium]|jgi:multicomponent K+:H+ antiporter subunit D|nr:monovalent cation/H+ antiporter subunit D [Burkholderiales bacterium]